MGILGKFSNNDDKYSEYKRMGEKILLLVKDRTEKLDRNFEDIMIRTNTIDIQSLRLSSFLAGFLAAGVENMKLWDMSLYKLTSLDRAVADVMTENGYRSFSFKEIDPEHLSQKSIENMTFMQGGHIISNLLSKSDMENCFFNITIFLDTLESPDGHYTEGESNKTPDIESLLSGRYTNQINIDELIKKNIINDESLYLTATREFEDKDIREALWAKCMVMNEGDEKKAKYSYINQRVEVLKKELANEISKQNHDVKIKEQERIDKAKQKDLERDSQGISTYKKIRRQEYEKLLQPYPEDKSRDIGQELATDNLFPLVMNANTRFILKDKLKKNVSDIIDNC